MAKQEIKIKVGIFSLSMLSMATLVMSPVIALVVKAFQNEGLSKVQMILSVGNLTGIVAAFLVGKLALSIPKRTIALTGALLTCIFGLIPYLFHTSLLFLIICSGLIGVSVGLITNVIPGLIADYFAADQRQDAMGKQVAFVSIGTMIIMYVSGVLGVTAWYVSYLTYALAGIVFVIVFVCLPKTNKVEETGEQEQHTLTEVVDRYVISVALFGFCFMIINNAFNNNLSLFVQQQKLGLCWKAVPCC